MMYSIFEKTLINAHLYLGERGVISGEGRKEGSSTCMPLL
jgi:hypothetical protein